MRLVKISTVLAGLFIGSVASAGQIVTIDFRDTDWDPADPQPTYTVDGVTANANNGNGVLYQDNTDGLGVRGGEHDEIDSQEWLEITIAPDYYDTHGLINGVLITDLFDAPDGQTGENGWVDVYLAGDVLLGRFEFLQLDDVINGELWVSFGGDYEIFRLVFGVDGRRDNEYSVAGLTSSVPEPSTLTLLGMGLLALGFVHRRRPLKVKS